MTSLKEILTFIGHRRLLPFLTYFLERKSNLTLRLYNRSSSRRASVFQKPTRTCFFPGFVGGKTKNKRATDVRDNKCLAVWPLVKP